MFCRGPLLSSEQRSLADQEIACHCPSAFCPLHSRGIVTCTDHPSSYYSTNAKTPADTPFEDGSFRLTLTFTDAYPNKPPTVRFVSRMFHPNIYVNGELCLDILQNRWSPTYDVAAILTSVQSLLNDPNPGRYVVNLTMLVWVLVWWGTVRREGTGADTEAGGVAEHELGVWTEGNCTVW